MHRSRAPMPQPLAPLVLRPEEVAHVLQISRWTVYEMIRTGALPSGLIGGSRRVPVDAVIAYIYDSVEEQA